jgi:hypothetical protein
MTSKKKIYFSFIDIFNYEDNKHNCISFILNLLHYLQIIPKFNYKFFIPDNFYFLPILSNNIYDSPIILEYDTYHL